MAQVPDFLREVAYWDHADQEYLSHSERDEAIESILEEIVGPLPETLEIFGFARMAVDEDPDCLAECILETIYERLDEELGSPDESTTPPDEVEEAAVALCKLAIDKYTPWACEIVKRETVNVREWCKENRPGFLKEAEFVVDTDAGS